LEVKEFEEEYLTVLETSHKEILDQLRTAKLTDEVTAKLAEVATDVASRY